MSAQFPTAIKSYTSVAQGNALPFDIAQSYQDEINGIESAVVNGQAQAIVYTTSSQSITSGVWTGITFGGEEIDIGALHSTATNPTRLTVSSGMTGRYYVSAIAQFSSSTSGGVRALRFNKNGANAGSYAGIPVTTSTNGVTLGLSNAMLISLTSGDYVEVQAFQDSGVALTIGGSSSNRQIQCQFSAVRQW